MSDYITLLIVIAAAIGILAWTELLSILLVVYGWYAIIWIVIPVLLAIVYKRHFHPF